MTTSKPSGRIGAGLHEFGAANQLKAIELAEQVGVETAWLTTGGVGPDAMGIFAAAAVRTERITLGTAIIPALQRHPLALVSQTAVITSLAPGRFRLGVGPSHKPSVEGVFGIPFERPLEYMTEYIHILRDTLQRGKVDRTGKRVSGHVELPSPPNVPVLFSALRPASYTLAGRISDGALAWVCPLPYLRDVALPAFKQGAARRKDEPVLSPGPALPAGRDPKLPRMVAHCFVAVHEDAAAVRAASQDRLAVYARPPSYQEMFALAGYPEARESTMSDRMLDAVVVHGDEATVARRLQEYLDAGMDEVIASVLVVGDDRLASTERTLRLIASL